MKNKKGATVVVVALVLLVLMGFAALAVDLGYLYIVKGELQNAADSGALAGAQVLYNADGTQVNESANDVALALVQANYSEQSQVTVKSIERGHWSFVTKTFTRNDSLLPVPLDVSTADLDVNVDFINAVRVITTRKTVGGSPGAPFFARIFGIPGPVIEAVAVAYIGFAGTLTPGEADQPIAICKQSIMDENGNYTCTTGRMINSSGGTTSNTAAWTNFSQPCETANPPSVSPLVCTDGNPNPISLGTGMGTVNGMQTPIYNTLRDCWLNTSLPKDFRGYPTEPWGLTLAVIDCPDSSIGPCSKVIGAVNLDVIWVKQSGADPSWRDIPLQMKGWECSTWVALGRPQNINSLDDSQRQQCWREFTNRFNLKTANETAVGDLTHSEITKTIYFLPDCNPHIPSGATGGQNFGTLARIPVLVK